MSTYQKRREEYNDSECNCSTCRKKEKKEHCKKCQPKWYCSVCDKKISSHRDKYCDCEEKQKDPSVISNKQKENLCKDGKCVIINIQSFESSNL